MAPSCTELVWDELFEGAWLAREQATSSRDDNSVQKYGVNVVV